MLASRGEWLSSERSTCVLNASDDAKPTLIPVDIGQNRKRISAPLLHMLRSHRGCWSIDCERCTDL